MKRSLWSVVLLASLATGLMGCAAESAEGMAKCDVCSKEFKAEELHTHDGKRVCAACDGH